MEAEGPGLRSTVITAAPVALAIGVFGLVYGAAANAVIDPLLAVVMSLAVFSGSLQFALIALVATGAGPAALLLTTIVLNVRHLVMGAIVRPRLDVSALRRALLAFFMVDESFGLSIAAGRRAALVLGVSGVTIYVTWVAGTILGVLGARLVSVESLAAAIFPVLFIGLAGLTARHRDGLIRAGVAGIAVGAASLLAPPVADYAPIVAAVLVALPSFSRGAAASPPTATPPEPEAT